MRVGDRVRLVHTDDPSGIPTGEEGTIIHITKVSKADVAGAPLLESLVGKKKIWIEWDRGGRLALIEGIDEFEVLPGKRT